MRKRTKIVNEPQKQPLTPEAQELKQAIQQTQVLPIEQVIYLSDTSYVNHIPGTSRYTIPYPETWRTQSNMDLYIGVRSINLRNADRTRLFTLTIKWEACLEVVPYDPTSLELVGETSWMEAYLPGEEFHPGNWAKEWSVMMDDLRNACQFQVKEGFTLSRWQWDYVNGEFNIYRVDDEGNRREREQNDYRCQFTVYVNEPFQVALRPIHYVYSSYDKIPHLELLSTSWKSHSEYLLLASFVNQTRWNYLGFTNTTFNPPKMYKLNANDTHYWIELASPDGTEDRELPADGVDFITLDIQLIAQPISNRL